MSTQPTLGDRWRSAWALMRANNAQHAWERAVYLDQQDVAQSLLKCGVSAAGMSEWVLFNAFDNHQDGILIAAIKAGANPNAQHLNNYNDFLLQRAAVRGRTEIVTVLLEQGARIENRCHNDFDALGAVVHGWGDKAAPLAARREMVQLLLQHGANAQNLQNNRSLLDNNDFDLEMAKILCAAGAPVVWNTKKYDQLGKTQVNVEKDSLNLCLLERWPIRRLNENAFEIFNAWLALGEGNAQLQFNGRHVCLAHLLFAKCAQPTTAWLDSIEQHLGPLDKCDAQGNTVWHTLFAFHTLHMGDMAHMLLEQERFTKLLAHPNTDGHTALDVLDEAVQNLNANRLSGYERNSIRACQQIVLSTLQRGTLNAAVSVAQPQSPRKRKL